VTSGRCLRVGHSIVEPGAPLQGLASRVASDDWDMVELDVLRRNGRLIVAHDPSDFELPLQVGFEDALGELVSLVGPSVRFDVDIKATGYEAEVAAAICRAGIAERALVSTMEASSLAALRREAPSLRLGLSVPLARRDYLAAWWTRPGAYAVLAYLRRVLPAQVAGVLARGEADAIMAHWGVVTARLVNAVCGRGAELFVWTVDDPGRLPGLLSLGVTGVITNSGSLFAGVL
jgi:glycerophosphoryl diester phosphodiesterase